ncbi:uncharacterized protein KY384_004650 [Bacidia gigantensis]|uniref:uncharacterized protein n=1 Tax=Bacidia gigantensis TaxID=2732470 RepID=UPI001D0432B2|nr:uncharacterized protein KY384_004650 [Bacidia gigantensis]KAG8530612.1 hypothetical protein KY384_004650 [Bacidia gigantensis]
MPETQSGKLSNTTTKEYQSSTLQSRDSFRLLRLYPQTPSADIKCSLKEVNIADKRGYGAVSYVWGVPNLTRKIYCGNAYIGVTEHIHALLRRVCNSSRDVYIWIDAICINQKDLTERSTQVLLMRKIFSDAGQILIWLGIDPGPAAPAFQIISDFNVLCDKAPKGAFRDNNHERLQSAEDLHAFVQGSNGRSIANLFQHDWFHRTWTFQEAFSARPRAALVLYGDYDIEYEELSVFAVYMCSLAIQGSLQTHRARMGVNHVVKIKQYANSENTLLGLLKITHARRATDARDKIYGLASLVDPKELPYPPSYEIDDHTLFRDQAVHMIKRAGNLRLLESCIFEDTVAAGLPSWAPSWAPTDTLVTAFHHEHEPFCPGPAVDPTRTPRVDGDILKVYGAVVDAIRKLGCKMELSDFESNTTSFADHENVIELLLDRESKELRDLATAYGSPEMRELARAQTLMGGRNRDVSRADADAAIKVRNHRRVSESNGGGASFGDYSVNDRAWNDFNEVAYQLMHAADGRRLCLTKSGRLGWVPLTSEEGDAISVLSGSQAAIVLRHQEDNRYQVIGGSYIHGIMDGEALKEPGQDDQLGFLQLV